METKEHKFLIAKHNNISRWDEILPEYQLTIKRIISYAKDEINKTGYFFLKKVLRNMYLKLPFYMEIRGIARTLKISIADCVLLQIVYEYYSQGSTVMYKNIFFRNIDNAELKQVSVYLNVVQENKPDTKVLTFAGYTGYLCIFNEKENCISSVEYNAKIPDLSMTQIIFRYIKYKKTPGQMLRILFEDNSSIVETVNVMKNNKMSVPFRLNIMSLKGILKIHPPIVNKIPAGVALVQTHGDAINPSWSIKDLTVGGMKYIKKENLEEIQKMYKEHFFVYCKLLNNRIIINGQRLQ